MLNIGDRVKFHYGYGKITDHYKENGSYILKSETTHEYYYRFRNELLKIVTIYAGIF
jgi:hypothetical protein